MNCFDCTATGGPTPAVAVCADCGAGVCLAHAHVSARWATRVMALNRVVQIDPPARTIRCGLCEQTQESVAPGAAAVPIPRRDMR